MGSIINTFAADRNTLPLSVIICTFNRSGLLKMTLDSLVGQTLGREKFEIVVIDDGSSDNTRQMAMSFADKLPLKYFYQNNAGLASARNHGIYASQGEMLFFCDDDDAAAPSLLEEHLNTHTKYPHSNFAVLNYTQWDPGLPVTPLMHFVTEIGCFLFSYPYIRHRDILDYTYFWGGRISCKRDFLIEHGVFNPVFRFGCEDIELGYRLSKQDLKVVFNKNAVAFMTRPATFEDFCQRLTKQGRSQYIFSTLHDDPLVRRWAEIPDSEKWPELEIAFESMKKSAAELDKLANMKLKHHLEIDALTKRLLHNAYWWVFKACKIKGIVEARESLESTGEQSVPTEKGREKNLPEIQTSTISSFEHYKSYRADMDQAYAQRDKYEAGLLPGEEVFAVNGYCYVCKRNTRFTVDYSYSHEKNSIRVPNWREHLHCPDCGLNNRMRAFVHFFESLLGASKNARIYISEQDTALYRWLSGNYPNLIGSEFLGEEIPAGRVNCMGIRNESLTSLSFADCELDFILSLDCLEHIPDYKKSFRECFRVLKAGGGFLFTVPFTLESERNIVRATLKDGKVEHILPPEYHYDPLNSKGCLAFYRFGWEMLDELKGAGFSIAQAVLYWSAAYGYLGGEQVMFIAKKQAR